MDLVHLAVEAEAAGFHSVWVSEHLWHSSYVANRLGDLPYHDPLTVLTAVASATSRIRLGTSVLVLPWHHPVRLAKTMASLDDLAEGRVSLGVGVAVTEDEFANLGVDFHTRGRQTDEALAAIRALWAEEFPAFDGEFYRFSGMRFEPKPMQPGGLPILIGGGSPAALRRVVRFGDGWHALGQSPAMLREGIAALGTLCASRNRTTDELHISTRVVMEVLDEPFPRAAENRKTLRGTKDEIRDTMLAFAEAGVDELVIDANTRDLAETRKVMLAALALAPGEPA